MARYTLHARDRGRVNYILLQTSRHFSYSVRELKTNNLILICILKICEHQHYFNAYLCKEIVNFLFLKFCEFFILEILNTKKILTTNNLFTPGNLFEE